MIEFYSRPIGNQHCDIYAVWPDGIVMCASEIPTECNPRTHEWRPSIRTMAWVRDNGFFEGYDEPPCQPRIGL